jgi:hypothetical protein
VKVSGFELQNEIVFTYFNKLPQKDRDEKLRKALYIGVLALMEDRISSFLAKTKNELGTELESLKLIFENKQELFYQTAIKGILAEEDIADYLNKYFDGKQLKDQAFLAGNTTGEIPKNKTGDIICKVKGQDDLKITIECKFDKSIKLGDISTKDVFTKRADTAWSQLIEANANRGSKISIIVLDRSLTDHSILNKFDTVGFIPSAGFITIIDSQKGDYSNLGIAYMLARDIAINSKEVDLDGAILDAIVNRLIKDVSGIMSIKKMISNNIKNNKEILKQLEKSLLSMEFNQQYLAKFLKDGTLTKKDLLDFYRGEGIKEKYRIIERTIDEDVKDV